MSVPFNSSNSSWQDNLSITEEDLKKPGFVLHLMALALSIAWLVFLAFYSSMIYGRLVTRVVNKFFLSSGHFNLDSLSWNFMAGKIMFKNLIYINEDSCVRVQDGFAVFKWWRPFVPSGTSDGHQASHSRLALCLNGFETHVYNRSDLYAELEEYFDIEPAIFAKSASDSKNKGLGSERLLNERRKPDSRYKPFYVTKTWRDLFPTIKVHLFSARFVFGNRLSPTTLVLSLEEGHAVYATKPAVSSVDPFVHVVNCETDNFKVLLARNDSYTAIVEEPPRYMGEGFVVFSSNNLQLYFRMDEAGFVPEVPQLVELANGEKEELKPPICSLAIKCGKGTNFSYGPWADRQRDQLYKIFYPQNYQPQQLSRPPVPGERRKLQSFDIHLSMLNEATMDILFSKQRETKAFHITASHGSYLEITIPWVVKEEGYTTKIVGQLFHVEACTSLQFRNLAECERLEFSVNMHYPLLWNDYQEWTFSIGGSRVSTYIVYDHKEFFQDLISDWSSRSMPDILQFVPYTWQFAVKFTEFEIVIPANEHNWIDCSSQHQENFYVGVCGDIFDLSFSLPFCDFLPEKQLLKFWIQGEVLELYLCLPAVNTNRDLLQTLMQEGKFVEMPGRPPFAKTKNRYQRYIKPADGWLHCWSVPIIALKFDFDYHPMSPSGPPALSLISTPDRENLLAPLRAPTKAPEKEKVLPNTLEPDTISVELEIGPSVIRFTGTLLLALVRLKDNIFGETQHFTDMDLTTEEAKVNEALEPDSDVDVRLYRPLKVAVSLVMHDIEAHVVTACRTGQTCPVVYIEQLAFEMDKSFQETRLQVILSPILMTCSDSMERPSSDAHLKDGFAVVNGFQFRGHAMFSEEGRKMEEETLEYAWMMDFHISSIVAKLTVPQVLHVGTAVQCLLHLVLDEENAVVPPNTVTVCYHGTNQTLCNLAAQGSVCPTASQLRYVMAKLVLESTEVYLVESGTAIKIEVDPVTVSYCNLHTKNNQAGATLLLQKIRLIQYMVSTVQHNADRISNRSSSTADSGRSKNADWTSRARVLSGADLDMGLRPDGVPTWLEIGLFDLGPIHCDFAMSLATKGAPAESLQRIFLRMHDQKTRRLWFLWTAEDVAGASTSASPINVVRCGCLNGCTFFGSKIEPGVSRYDRVAQEYFPGESLLDRGKPLLNQSLQSTLALHKASTSTVVDSLNQDHKDDLGELETQRSDSVAEHSSSVGDNSNSEDTVVLKELTSKWVRAIPARTHSSSVLSREKSGFAGSFDSGLQKPKISREISASTPAVNDARSSVVQAPRVMPAPSLEAQLSVKSSELNSELFLSAEEYDSESTSGNDSDDDSERQLMIRRRRPDAPSIAPKAVNLGSSTSSLSSTSSFSSAVSSQNERELSLVDLRMQSNKPVSQSPLLMGTYLNHLTQVQCNRWCTEKRITRQGVSRDFYRLPQYCQVTQGFTTLPMVPRENRTIPPTPSPSLLHRQRRVSSESPWESPIISGIRRSETSEPDIEEAVMVDKSSVYCNTVVVKVVGAINIMLTPLVLESLQRFLDTASDYKSHSVSVLTSTRASCISTVVQGHSFLPEGLVEPSTSEITKKINRPTDASTKWKMAAQPKRSFGNIVAVQTQGSLSVDKVNICVLQAGVVEELISFSALDSPRDLVCVSLLAACVENVTLFGQTKKYIMQSYQSRTQTSREQSFRLSKRQSRKVKTPQATRPDQIVLVLNQVKEDQSLLVLNTKRIHAQLRRLRNESSTLQRDAVITAIPPRCSRVMFAFDPKNIELERREGIAETLKKVDIKEPDRPSEFGLIMLEVGLESITGKIIKKYPLSELSQEESTIQRLQSISEDSESPVPQKNIRTTSFTTKVTNTKLKLPAHSAPQAEKQETTSCVTQIGGIWFGFAAPPRTPITKKMEYTRLDWNLLSTSSPAISSWISCIDRFVLSVKHFDHMRRRWELGVLAVLMAENLDLPRQEIPKKSKYAYFSSKSLAAREDPSTRLCMLLQKSVQDMKPGLLETSLHEQHLPPPDTTEQGILVLLRQWKGSFIVPLVIENTAAPSKKGFLNVNFSRNLLERKKSDRSNDGSSLIGGESNSAGSSGGKNSSSSSIQKPDEPIVQHAAMSDWIDATNPLLSAATTTQRRRSSPVPSFGLFGSRNPTPLFGENHSESEGIPTPTVGHRHDVTTEGVQQDERQYLSGIHASLLNDNSFRTSFHKAGIAGGSFLKKFQRSESSTGDSPVPPLAQVQGLNPGLDAQVVFTPLLAGLKISTGKQNTGPLTVSGIASIVSSIEELKVDLFESEMTVTSMKNSKGKRPLGKVTINLPPETPAFTCEKITFEAEAKGKQSEAVNKARSFEEKSDTDTTISFSVGVGFVSQQVNMPLLRLVHQIYTMYNNAQNASNQLHDDIPLAPMPLNIPPSESDASEAILSTASESSQTLPDPDPRNVSRASSVPQHETSFQKSGLTSASASPAITRAAVPSTVPRSWKKIFHLLDLYKAVPTQDTVLHRIDERIPLRQKKNAKINYKATEKSRYSAAVFGVIRLARVRLLATLSGLKLEADLSNIQSSLNYKEGLTTTLHKPDIENSMSCHLGEAMVVLLEGIAPNQQTVVKVNIGKSQGLYSVQSKSSDELNSALLSIGLISVDIPQHPAVLHGMMTRGTKELSTTLQEFRSNRISSRSTRTTSDDVPNLQKLSPLLHRRQESNRSYVADTAFFQPLLVQFSFIVERISVTAALLPSLEAEYQMASLVCSGVTGSKASFTLDLNKHSLSFNTKLQSSRQIPPSACIELPAIHGNAEYLAGNMPSDLPLENKMVLRKGGYLKAVAEIGMFEHCLTTDLLNHLVLVQKVFMKEINEVLLKVSGGDKLVPLWEDEDSVQSDRQRLLYTLTVHLKGIQLTATTATNSAVRFETDHLEVQLSNRVLNVAGAAKTDTDGKRADSFDKLFISAAVDLNLSLGQLIQNVLFEEAEPEYIPVAFFRTKVGFRKALENEVGEGRESDQEVVFLSLTRPLIYLQPEAVDKAILVWLNYKNAYEYWKEQRSDLGKDSHVTADVLLDRMMSQKGDADLSTIFVQVTVDDMGVCLPLQQLPSMGVKNFSSAHSEIETTSAVVVTLESSKISACISGCFVSKGEFSGLCLRFDDDFELNFDDWKPDMTRSLPMNRCVVSEGTYEICSRTIAQQPDGGNAKWFLNVSWQMEGLDAHLDINIGRQLAALGRTLTRLAEGEEEMLHSTAPSTEDEAEDLENVESNKYYLGVELRNPRPSPAEPRTKHSRPTASAVTRRRTMLIKREMAEQAKLINELKSGGASSKRLEEETRKLQELESLASKHVRRDIAHKFNRGSVQASAIKGKLGIGTPVLPHPRTRSRSASVHAGTMHQSKVTEIGHPRTHSIPVPPIRIFSDEEEEKLVEETPVVTRPYSKPTNRFQRSHTVTCSSVDAKAETGDLSDDGEEEDDDVDDDLEIFAPMSSPELEDSRSFPSVSEASSGRQSSAAYHRQHEPNVDLELNVKVVISSGKCVLYAEDYRDLEQRRLRKDRSYSAEMGGQGTSEPQSPGSIRRKAEMKALGSATKVKHFMSSQAVQADRTVFHIPGLDIKVLYESKMVLDEMEWQKLQKVARTPPSLSSGSLSTKKTLIKKASLFTWMSLESIPEETVVSPQILDFLEKALEPIPITVPEAKPPSSEEGSRPSVFTLDLDGSSVTDSTSSPGAYGSFPVDVVVYFHMQPSAVRFSSLPVSRVECLLRLPSLHLVFSSKRVDSNQFEGEFSDSSINPRPAAMLPLGSVGGLSVTGCLSDFSLYVFHPYGGGKKGTTKPRDGTPTPPTGEEAPSTASAENERKDSLSVNVEFVKFALSRSRKVDYVDSSDPEAGTKATIRFSTIIDIGSASFKYDMRRLPEILAFPKAWYRRSIVRRVFLGDSTKKEEARSEENRGSKSEAPDARPRSQSARDNPSSTKTQEVRFTKPGSDPRKIEGTNRKHNLQISQWETLVVYAINFKKLNVHMNMGNVMGNIVWQTKDFRCDGKLSISSTGHKNLSFGCGLEGSSLDAKGGIVGGSFEVSCIETSVQVREDPNVKPEHRADLHLQALECRLDYMGSSTLMGRISNLAASLKDEWRLEILATASEHRSTSLEGQRNTILLDGDLSWDQFQMLISRSTTVDLIKMYVKLEEFFSQQFKSSRRLFSNIQQPRRPSMNSLKWKADKAASEKTAESPTVEPQHHRHWQSVLKLVSGMRMETLAKPLPTSGTILGGTVELHGGHISLACFNGVNFKAKSWAVFSLKDPFIRFTTEANEVEEGNLKIAESLSFTLGLSQAQKESKAMVTRMSRNQLFVPQCKTFQDWFMYAFASSDLDDVNKFPPLKREKPASDPEKRPTTKLTDFTHQKEIIFAFPSLQMHLKTDHIQGQEPPDLLAPRPVVECSLITDFEDPILITFDAEMILFLHDLIASYVKEREKLVPSTVPGRSQGQSDAPKEQESSDPVSSTGKSAKPATEPSTSSRDDTKGRVLVKEEDWRTFDCKTWHLEPAFRLLAFTGQKIDPIGVDFILNKLGFAHARTTIPKWVQRGAMDPLDKLIAILLSKALTVIAKKADSGETKRTSQQ